MKWRDTNISRKDSVERCGKGKDEATVRQWNNMSFLRQSLALDNYRNEEDKVPGTIL